ncbi:hypothetical protein THRCLA_11041 [Thraustotheca clavata]|uniref:Non-haem dioxygenase N-terminal domain-containing protein n=1 Tax=Thraustotheca clavata TaxID=74557 RepID=A0A1V9Y953_9STRA|nr:hypothetical protein THRCLA_11041 [Thraustotheca clavata]
MHFLICKMSINLISDLPAQEVPIVSFNTLSDSNDLGAIIEAAYGPKGLGILAVANVPGLEELRAKLLPLAFKFANLPDEVKAKYELPKAYYSFGWSHGKENLQGKPDYSKGSFYNNPLHNVKTTDATLIEEFPTFYHDNVWPTDEIPELEEAFMHLGQLIVNTGLLVAQQCDKYVESKCPTYEAGKLYRIIKQSRSCVGRLLHYFAMAQKDLDKMPAPTDCIEEDFSSWCGWHNDHSALTGLVQALFTDKSGNTIDNPDPSAGLYIKNRDGQIIRALIPKGHLVYQIGETSQILTGGILQATPHAVRGPRVPDVNRETLAVFMGPEHDEPMQVPEGTNPQDAGQTANLPLGNMLTGIREATPIVCNNAFQLNNGDAEPVDVDGAPFSYRRCIISIVTYFFLITDVPRTATFDDTVQGLSIEPNIYLRSVPMAQHIAQIIKENDNTFIATQNNKAISSLPVSIYKYDPSAAALRGFVYNRNLWLSCLDYVSECPSESLDIAQVFDFWSNITQMVATSLAPRAFQSVDTTLKYSLRVQDDRLDRIFDYIAFQFVDLTAYRSIWVSHVNSTSLIKSLCSVYAIGRPLLCSKTWARSIYLDIAQQMKSVQEKYPFDDVDLFIAESEADPARRHGGLAYVGFSAFDMTTVMRVRRNNATIMVDEHRYSGNRIWSNSHSWTSYTQGFRYIGQTYMILRLIMLFLGFYIATDKSLRKTLHALLMVPSQVVVYGSWFPVACYAVAHLIDASVSYTIVEQQYSTLGDFLSLPFTTICSILAVRMRAVWVIALLIKLFSFVINIGVWHPNGTVGLRGHLIPGLTFIALISIFQVASLRDSVPVRAVYTVEPSTIIALYMSEVFTDMNNRLSGLYHDLLSIVTAFLLIAMPIGLIVYWHRRHHRNRKPLFFVKSKTPFAAAKLWSYTAMTVSWGDGLIDVDHTTPGLTATAPMPLDESACSSRLNSRIASRKTSTAFFRKDNETSSSLVFMNIVQMSDPITFLWLSSGSLVVYEYMITSPDRAKKCILHPFTKDDIVYHCYDITREELTLQATLLTKEISWKRLIRCY